MRLGVLAMFGKIGGNGIYSSSQVGFNFVQPRFSSINFFRKHLLAFNNNKSNGVTH
jgi:hypothetical protein